MKTIALKEIKKKPLQTSHALFNRQRNRIETLRKRLHAVTQECERALLLYHSELKPQRTQTGEIISQYLLKIKQLTDVPKALNKNERTALQEILKEDLEHVFFFLPYKDIAGSIKEIYREVFGYEADKNFKDEVSEMQKEFQEFGFKDVDFSQLNPEDDMTEYLKKIGEATFARANEDRESIPPPKIKSKKELLKEKKARELETLQNKTLGNVYKRLAREWHPDLEQDPNLRKRKEQLMKELTASYENKDLLSLLKMESEWLGELGKDSENLDEDSLKVYNSLLKDQIDELETEIEMIHLHPRYIDIFFYISDYPKNPLRGIRESVEYSQEVRGNYEVRLNDLNGNQPLKNLKSVLKFKLNGKPDFLEVLSEVFAGMKLDGLADLDDVMKIVHKNKSKRHRSTAPSEKERF